MAQVNRRFPQRRDPASGSRYSDLTGARFGSWVAISRSYSKWLCRCDCGEERLVFAFALINGSSQSCGCRPRTPRLKLTEPRITTTIIKGVKFYAVLPTDNCTVPRALFQDISEAREYRDYGLPRIEAIDALIREARGETVQSAPRMTNPGTLAQLRAALGITDDIPPEPCSVPYPVVNIAPPSQVPSPVTEADAERHAPNPMISGDSQDALPQSQDAPDVERH